MCAGPKDGTTSDLNICNPTLGETWLVHTDLANAVTAAGPLAVGAAHGVCDELVSGCWPYLMQGTEGEDVSGNTADVLASLEPLEIPTIEQAIARMPAAAKKDMTEWCQRFGDKVTLQLGWRLVLAEFKPVEEFLPKDRSIVITDDRPFNEYFWLRRLGGSK